MHYTGSQQMSLHSEMTLVTFKAKTKQKVQTVVRSWSKAGMTETTEQ